MPPVPRVPSSDRGFVLAPKGAPYTKNSRPAFEPNHAKAATYVPGVNARYTLNLGAASAGTFTLTLAGVGTTAGIAFNAANSAVVSAIEAIAGVGTVQVTGGPLPGTTITIEFIGNEREQPNTLTGNFAGLTGATPVLTQTQAGVLAVQGAPMALGNRYIRGGQVGKRQV